EQAYQAAMSRGLQALQSGNYNPAIQAFEQALKHKPGDSSARSSLIQARDENQSIRLNKLVSRAQALEQQELWHMSSELFQQALNSDDTLVAARVGLLRSQTRAKLDDRLQQMINNPLRLSADSVYREASALL